MRSIPLVLGAVSAGLGALVLSAPAASAALPHPRRQCYFVDVWVPVPHGHQRVLVCPGIP